MNFQPNYIFCVIINFHDVSLYYYNFYIACILIFYGVVLMIRNAGHSFCNVSDINSLNFSRRVSHSKPSLALN